MEISFFFAWYDFWIGWFYDQKKKVLYVCPLSCCVIKIEKRQNKTAKRYSWIHPNAK